MKNGKHGLWISKEICYNLVGEIILILIGSGMERIGLAGVKDCVSFPTWNLLILIPVRTHPQ